MCKFIFIGGIIPEKGIKDILKVFGYVPQVPSETLQKNIINGLEKNLNQHVTVFNTYFLPSIKKPIRIKSFLWESENGVNYNVPFIYIKVFQHFSKYYNLKNKIAKYLKESKNKHKHYIFIYSAYFPFLLVAYYLKKHFNIEICLIVPDLPQYMGLDSKDSFYRNTTKIISKWIFEKTKKCIDSYVFLTQHMNKALNKENKKYIVMEGIATNEYIYHNNKHEIKKRTVLYSGTLQFKYGINILLDAIKLIPDQNVEFVFYGNGEGAKTIIEASKTDKRIIYNKPIQKESLYFEQQKSTILINPRQNTNDFTKYSFPSKTLEYMLSGRPIITYKLDGIPDEYDEFLIYPSDNTVQELATVIIKTLACDEKELCEKGSRGRKFVLENKNYLTQTRKIVNLLNIAEAENSVNAYI